MDGMGWDGSRSGSCRRLLGTRCFACFACHLLESLVKVACISTNAGTLDLLLLPRLPCLPYLPYLPHLPHLLLACFSMIARQHTNRAANPTTRRHPGRARTTSISSSTPSRLGCAALQPRHVLCSVHIVPMLATWMVVT